MPPSSIADVRVLAFDVFGTVVDFCGSIAREVEALGLGVDGEKFALAWRAGYLPAMQRVRSGVDHDLWSIRRQTLFRDRQTAIMSCPHQMSRQLQMSCLHQIPLQRSMQKEACLRLCLTCRTSYQVLRSVCKLSLHSRE